MKNCWKIGYYIATYILALVAITGFIFSTRSSKNISEVLKSVQEDFASSTQTLQDTSKTLYDLQREFTLSNQPLIKFNKIKWFKDGEISCDNPPIGVLAICSNLSNVPIQIYETDARFFYGTKELDDITKEIGNPGVSIIAPGETHSVGTIQKELFQKYLGREKNVLEPPFLKIKLKIVYSRLGSTERYIYESTQNIGINCSNGNWQMYPSDETIFKVTD